MKNGILHLDWANVADAVLTAIITAVVVAAVSLVTTAGFDIFTANWTAIGHSMANLAFIAGVISLGKDLLSTNTGSLLGVGPESNPLG